ncbi:MAG: FISUMP domain-containing protein [Bacteroidales bacterium]|nr:FISUMP domain-containing protein [Bacteroidales bacterium]
MSQEANTFTDPRDNKIYNYVRIGNQVWMADNLAFKPESGNFWAYDNDSTQVEKYGYLYDYRTAKNVCPSGWRLPTKSDFEILISKYEDAHSNAFAELITGGISRFNMVYGGWRDRNGQFYARDFGGNLWSATVSDDDVVWFFLVVSNYRMAYLSRNIKELGFSVRCIKQ